MAEHYRREQMAVRFEGAIAGTEPLTWGQKAILLDMRESSGHQFSMPGRIDLPDGSTVEDAAARLSGLMGRHAALRLRLSANGSGAMSQEVVAAGQIDLDILTLPDEAGPADIDRFLDDLWENWPLARFDFSLDWPLRMALIRHRGDCLCLAWVLSHVAADGGGHVLLFEDLRADEVAGPGERPLRRPDILDIARKEQEQASRQQSRRAIRYWSTRLADIPEQTFAESAVLRAQTGDRYRQARFCSLAAHLAMAAIGSRTGTDAARVALAVIATAIGRVTGAAVLTIKVLVNNRFRPGLADVIAPVSQASVVAVRLADATVDEVIARTRADSLAAGMRAYYDPDELAEAAERLDAERGYPARITCRVNDQRAMTMRADVQASADEITRNQLDQALAQTSLTWLGRRENLYGQVNILVERRSDVVSLHMMWDSWCLSDADVESILRGVEEVAIEAAFDPAAPAQV